jgi:signal transduction histidine kinase
MENDIKKVLKELDKSLEKLCKEGNIFYGFSNSRCVMKFAVFMYYSGIFLNEIPSSKNDVTRMLNGKGEYLKNIWDQVNNEDRSVWAMLLNDEQIHNVFSLVHEKGLNNYKNLENDKEIASWSLSIDESFDDVHYTDPTSDSKGLYIPIIYGIIYGAKDSLGIGDVKRNILVNGYSSTFFELIINDDFFDGIYTFVISNKRYTLTMILQLLERYKKYNLIINEDEKSLPSDINNNFDAIILFGKFEMGNDDDNHDENTANVDYAPWLNILNDGGVCIANGQPLKRMPDEKNFVNYDFPAIIQFCYESIYVIRKSNHSNIVHMLDVNNYDDRIKAFLIDAIKCQKYDNLFYQKLEKQDFFLHKDDISFYKIKRDVDEIGFNYFDVSKLITNITSWTPLSCDVPDGKIVLKLYPKSLNINLPKFYYLDETLNDKDNHKIGYDRFDIDDTGKSNISLGGGDLQEAISRFLMNDYKGTDDEKSLYNLLTCAILTHPVILRSYYTCQNSFIRVNASSEHPVCYRKLTIDFSEYTTEYFEFRVVNSEVILNPDFDEDCLLMQLNNIDINSFDEFIPFTEIPEGKFFILLPPTREEQHAYYEKKKQDFIISNFNMMDEVRRNERKDIMNEISEMVHNSAQYMSGLQSGLDIVASLLPEENKDIKVPGDENRTINGLLSELKKDVNRVHSSMKGILEVPSEPNLVNASPVGILYDYLAIKAKHNYKIDLVDNNIENKCLVDIEKLKAVFDNIIDNSERHGFIDGDRRDYTQVIEVEKNDNILVIKFKNNGKRPDETFTADAYFTKGCKVGPTGNTGLGGYQVKKYIEQMGGMVSIDTTDKNYTFIVTLKLHIEK